MCTITLTSALFRTFKKKSIAQKKVEHEDSLHNIGLFSFLSLKVSTNTQ